MTKSTYTRRQMLQLSAAAATAPHPPQSHRRRTKPEQAPPATNLYAQLLQTWCDGLLAHQSTNPGPRTPRRSPLPRLRHHPRPLRRRRLPTPPRSPHHRQSKIPRSRAPRPRMVRAASQPRRRQLDQRRHPQLMARHHRLPLHRPRRSPPPPRRHPRRRHPPALDRPPRPRRKIPRHLHHHRNRQHQLPRHLLPLLRPLRSGPQRAPLHTTAPTSWPTPRWTTSPPTISSSAKATPKPPSPQRNAAP